MDVMYGFDQGNSGCFKDDLTVQILRDDLVKKARAVELEFFDTKGLWVKVPRQRWFERTGKPPLTARWVEVNKGDEASPNCRSRFGCQLRAMDKSGATYFRQRVRWRPFATCSGWR